MKLHYPTPLVAPTGDSYLDEKGQPMTLGSALVLAASLALPGDDQLSLPDKVGIGQAGLAVHRGLDLTVEQVAKLKDRVIRGFGSPVLTALVVEHLEGTAS